MAGLLFLTGCFISGNESGKLVPGPFPENTTTIGYIIYGIVTISFLVFVYWAALRY